ncbi:sigma factor [Aeromicrobium sp.]|uniref:sigma factor n=1 Tax=Aeromicrobium sp. TaxID=1871063 RepID=UPI0040349AF7
MPSDDILTAAFEAERPRLQRLAARILSDHDAAQDVVQHAWLRLHGTEESIDNLPGWLTTVTSRLCLDRLRARTPIPVEDVGPGGTVADPVDEVVLADTVGVALQVVLDRLTPAERVSFVLHDSFAFDFATIAAMLGTTPAAARKLASRARARVSAPVPEDRLASWEVVDAFMAAAKEGDLERLLELLAPGVVVEGDAAAVALGTPSRLDGAGDVAGFFRGGAHAAFPVFVGDRPGAAWIHRGEAKVAFDFTIADGRVHGIVFRAEAEVLATVRRRAAGDLV